MKKGWVIFWVILMIVIACSFMATLPKARNVEVNLVNVIGDQLPYYEFKVDGREIQSGQKVKVFRDFVIEVFKVETDKKTLIDKVNIGSLLNEGDKVSAAYYGEASMRGEAVCIYIEHADGSSREVSIDIN